MDSEHRDILASSRTVNRSYLVPNSKYERKGFPESGWARPGVSDADRVFGEVGSRPCVRAGSRTVETHRPGTCGLAADTAGTRPSESLQRRKRMLEAWRPIGGLIPGSSHLLCATGCEQPVQRLASRTERRDCRPRVRFPGHPRQRARGAAENPGGFPIP